MSSSLLRVLRVCVGLGTPLMIAAQSPYRPSALADSEIRPTYERVRELQRDVSHNPNDDVRWHELGMLAWALEPAVAAGNVPKERPNRIARIADSALQTAALIKSDNVSYQLFAANRLLESDVAIARTTSRKYFRRAVNAARASNDKNLVAAAALEFGRMYWWRFDARENRHLWLGAVSPRSINDAMNPMARGAATLEQLTKDMLAQQSAMLSRENPSKVENDLDRLDLTPTRFDASLERRWLGENELMQLPRQTFKGVRDLLKTNAQRLPQDLAGATDYEEASRLFLEAYRANPSYPGAFRALAMTYASRNLWDNVSRVASTHVAAFPQDSVAWMTLGLARYRLGDVPGAWAAFDRGLAAFSPAERRRLDNWKRVLPPGDRRGRELSATSAEEDLYWQNANPLWADSLHDARLEFLARTTYAELRWTVDAAGVRGADTDRGSVYVRYGPPETTYSFGASKSDEALNVVQFWVFGNGLVFAFTGLPTFGAMRIPAADVGMADELQRLFPVRWENVGAPATDSLDTRLSRFRVGADAPNPAATDSIDVAVAVNYLAPDSIGKTMSVMGNIERHLWILGTGGGSSVHLSSLLGSAGSYLWSARVSPGTMAYRAEAHAETATRAQRSTGVIDATTPEFPLWGAGISDMLVASEIDESVRGGTKRWNEVPVVAAGGTLARGKPFTVLWENYEFAERNLRNEYDVTLTLKADRGKGERIRAEVVGALAALARMEMAPDQVTFTFSRSIPAAPAVADWITIGIPDAPSGRYTLSLTITDQVSGREFTRTVPLEIRD